MPSRIHLQELSDKVLYMEAQSVPYNVAERIKEDFEDKGFEVIFIGMNGEQQCQCQKV